MWPCYKVLLQAARVRGAEKIDDVLVTIPLFRRLLDFTGCLEKEVFPLEVMCKNVPLFLKIMVKFYAQRTERKFREHIDAAVAWMFL